MIADRLLARLRELVGFVPTRWSLVRIACITVGALVIVSQLIPYRPGNIGSSYYNTNLGTDHSRVVSLGLGDTRGFKTPQHPHTFRIAWIGGSEVLGVNPKARSVIPGLVNDRIRSVDGRPARTDIYFLNAIRLGDELAALKKALSTKPDLVVVSLNPVWVLNDLAVQQWGYLNGDLVRGSLWPPSDWPVAASLVSPGDVGWRVLSRVSSAVRDRFDWGVQMTKKTSGLSFLHTVPGGKEPAPKGLALLAQSRPVDFWQRHFDRPPKNATLIRTQLSILTRELASKSDFNERILKEMFDSVRRAGVDTYFYMPAIAPQVYADPEGTRYINALEKRLAEVTKGLTNSRVHFDPHGLQDRVPPTKYEDIIHKLHPGPEVKVLTGDLCALLEQRGHRTDCEAP